MIYVGIDYSLNSPGICIYDDLSKEHEFISFSHNKEEIFSKKKIPQGIIHHKNLRDNRAATIYFYDRKGNDKDYVVEQFNKVYDADLVAEKIINVIPDGAIVAMEGFSYGSKGSSFIDIIFANAILRNKIFRLFMKGAVRKSPIIFSPSEIKKYAGKGNANKVLMFNFFLEKAPDSKFKEYVQSLEIEDSIPKPIDDLIDAYWICEFLRYQYKMNNI